MNRSAQNAPEGRANHRPGLCDPVKTVYEHPCVRARMIEFLGGTSLRNVTCEYVTSGDTAASRHREPRSVEDLPALWQDGRDLSRSLWDHRSLIAHLDIEYVNFDFPSEAYAAPERIFELQRPVEWAIESVLLEHGIVPLHLLSGRGHHFVWRIRQRSQAAQRLTEIGRLTPELKKLYARPHRPAGHELPEKLGAAFAGLALVLEYLAHRIKAIAAARCSIPVELTAVEVGPRDRGREMVSIDLSEYGDPLTARVIRLPFSLYLKPWQQRSVLGDEVVQNLPSMVVIPLHELDSRQGLQVMRDTGKAVDLACRASAEIPDQSAAMSRLLKAYEESSIARFHEWFYSQEHETPEAWPRTYDQTPMEPLPLCVRHVLEHPNDLLLRPACLERIVRVLLSLGWHPRHIAGLIRSKFERDCDWGDQWKGYDPGTRADFYTRLFAGLFATDRDDLVDFNCQSAREERLCFIENCPDNLERFRKSLLNRRNYERLACRPFHGLFLPEEHL